MDNNLINIDYKRLPLIGRLKINHQYYIFIFLFVFFLTLSFIMFSNHNKNKSELDYIKYSYLTITTDGNVNLEYLNSFNDQSNKNLYNIVLNDFKNYKENNINSIKKLSNSILQYSNSITFKNRVGYLYGHIIFLFLSFFSLGLIFLIFSFESENQKIQNEQKIISSNIALIDLMADLLPFEQNNFTKMLTVSENAIGNIADKINSILKNQIDSKRNITDFNNNIVLKINSLKSFISEFENNYNLQYEKNKQNINLNLNKVNVLNNKNTEFVEKINDIFKNIKNIHSINVELNKNELLLDLEKILFLINKNLDEQKKLLNDSNDDFSDYILTSNQNKKLMILIIDLINDIKHYSNLINEDLSKFKIKP